MNSVGAALPRADRPERTLRDTLGELRELYAKDQIDELELETRIAAVLKRDPNAK